MISHNIARSLLQTISEFLYMRNDRIIPLESNSTNRYALLATLTACFEISVTDPEQKKEFFSLLKKFRKLHNTPELKNVLLNSFDVFETNVINLLEEHYQKKNIVHKNCFTSVLLLIEIASIYLWDTFEEYKDGKISLKEYSDINTSRQIILYFLVEILEKTEFNAIKQREEKKNFIEPILLNSYKTLCDIIVFFKSANIKIEDEDGLYRLFSLSLVVLRKFKLEPEIHFTVQII